MRKILAALVTLATIMGSARAQKIETQKPDQDRIVHVQTSLNHLTVIEVGGPVTMVAAGSEGFKVEWRENKVFVQPTEPNAATNLFVWTASGRFNYELEPAGPVTAMDFAIDQPAPRPPRASNRCCAWWPASAHGQV
jgi:type IV secretory pathway VirB9-like protein